MMTKPEIRRKRVLVLGAAGMLGNAVMRYFAESQRHDVFGSVRTEASVGSLPEHLRPHVVPGIDVDSMENLTTLFGSVRPDVTINCIGVVKQLAEAHDPLIAIPINSLLPHRLARLCAANGGRLLHVSTDCVFSGARGMYRESDLPDAVDLYGRSKLLGEVDYPHAITLRTSMIGHGLRGTHGLVQWFLAQQDSVRGYTRAVFSGLPTIELARVMHDFVIPNDSLHGVYHVSATAIDKYSLLCQVAQAYGRKIEIVPDDSLVIDRSLDASRFEAATGYKPPGWPDLVARMRQFG